MCHIMNRDKVIGSGRCCTVLLLREHKVIFTIIIKTHSRSSTARSKTSTLHSSMLLSAQSYLRNIDSGKIQDSYQTEDNDEMAVVKC